MNLIFCNASVLSREFAYLWKKKKICTQSEGNYVCQSVYVSVTVVFAKEKNTSKST